MATQEETLMAQSLAAAVGGARMEVGVTSGGFRSREVKYWRMCTRPGCPRHRDRKGWITLGPTRRTDRENFSFYIGSKHMEELPDSYGVETVGETMVSTVDLGRSSFVPILGKGGIKEFPADQIVALGWHRLQDFYTAAPPELVAEVQALIANAKQCEYGCVSPYTQQPMEFYNNVAFSNHLKVHHKDAAGPEAVGKQMAKVMDRMIDVQQSPKSDLSDPEVLAKMFAQAVYTLEEMRKSGASENSALAKANAGVPEEDDLTAAPRRHSRVNSPAEG